MLLRDFYSGNKPDINVSGVSFELLLQDDKPVMIYGDKRKLVSVLQNLVFNAVSFTPEGGTICLSLNQEKEFAILRVKDTGSGISEEDIPYIFDRLFTNRIHENSNGMGLFIVKIKPKSDYPLKTLLSLDTLKDHEMPRYGYSTRQSGPPPRDHITEYRLLQLSITHFVPRETPSQNANTRSTLSIMVILRFNGAAFPYFSYSGRY